MRALLVLAMTTNAAMLIDETHDASLRSWVESAEDPSTDFPIQNLPLCCFERSHDGHSHAHLGVAIGDSVLDVTMLMEAGAFADDEALQQTLHQPYALGFARRMDMLHVLRRKLQWFLRADTGGGQQTRRLRSKALVAQADLRYTPALPHFNYTDFYASKHHASNVGAMFRPDNPLLPNYTHVPIGYHGRSSSIVMSGSDIQRPAGQTKADDAQLPSVGPCKMLDYELELGLIVGAGNRIGDPIDIKDVRRQLFGMCLLNDWSARDMQKWEYQPLGPFLAKNFATTISNFVVTMPALEPFRIPGPERGPSDPEPLPYLKTDDHWGYDITVEAWLSTEEMRTRGLSPHMLSRGNFKHMFWTVAQLVTHHASNGCNLQPGDLLGSGTISGPERTSRGCLLELTWDGPPGLEGGKPKPRKAIELPSGETRVFLADGDEVILRACCEREGFRRVGFGSCAGRVVSR
jgi:fumarylacetoacetase